VSAPEEVFSYWFPEGIDDADPQTHRHVPRLGLEPCRRQPERTVPDHRLDLVAAGVGVSLVWECMRNLRVGPEWSTVH